MCGVYIFSILAQFIAGIYEREETDKQKNRLVAGDSGGKWGAGWNMMPEKTTRWA